MMGFAFIGLLVHEGFHLIESVEPHSICYDFEQEAIAHVEAKDFRTNGEFFAYYFQSLIILGGFLYLLKDENKED